MRHRGAQSERFVCPEVGNFFNEKLMRTLRACVSCSVNNGFQPTSSFIVLLGF